MTTLLEIVGAYPSLFYAASQTWWLNEPFAAREFDPLDEGEHGVSAARLAWRYVQYPHSPIWRRFIWTDDRDRHGNRVYVAGLGQFGCAGFQIHRLLTPDHRWTEWRDL